MKICPTCGCRMSLKNQVIDAHNRNPNWNAEAIAKFIDRSSAYVRATASRNNLKLPRRDKS